MKVNEIGLWRMIDQRIRYLGLTAEEVNLQAFCVEVRSTNEIIELKQDTVVLVNTELDIPPTAQIILDAGNNKLETSKLDYENLAYSAYQFFQDRISVITSNYGMDFIPYRLEFIRISPNPNPNPNPNPKPQTQ